MMCVLGLGFLFVCLFVSWIKYSGIALNVGKSTENVQFEYSTGDAGVGKSSICQVFHSDSAHFPKNYSMVRIIIMSDIGL